jgi:hypothetical protein
MGLGLTHVVALLPDDHAPRRVAEQLAEEVVPLGCAHKAVHVDAEEA